MIVVDTDVHVFTEDRKKYPPVHDTARGAKVPTIRDIGQTDRALTVGTLARLMRSELVRFREIGKLASIGLD